MMFYITMFTEYLWENNVENVYAHILEIFKAQKAL